jgi:hypothetical protein
MWWRLEGTEAVGLGQHLRPGCRSESSGDSTAESGSVARNVGCILLSAATCESHLVGTRRANGYLDGRHRPTRIGGNVARNVVCPKRRTQDRVSFHLHLFQANVIATRIAVLLTMCRVADECAKTSSRKPRFVLVVPEMWSGPRWACAREMWETPRPPKKSGRAFACEVVAAWG